MESLVKNDYTYHFHICWRNIYFVAASVLYKRSQRKGWYRFSGRIGNYLRVFDNLVTVNENISFSKFCYLSEVFLLLEYPYCNRSDTAHSLHLDIAMCCVVVLLVVREEVWEESNISICCLGLVTPICSAVAKRQWVTVSDYVWQCMGDNEWQDVEKHLRPIVYLACSLWLPWA